MIKSILSKALAIVLVCFSFGCFRSTPEIYLIPAEFKGRVNIVFDIKEGVAPKMEGSSRVYEIPNNGILLTQLEHEDGYVNRQYFQIKNGKRYPLKVFLLADEQNVNDEVGVYRDGTIGIYGETGKGEKAYQEFFICSSRELKSYFSDSASNQFFEEVKQLAGLN